MATGVSAPVAGQRWRAEDRTLITSYDDVRAIARGRTAIFVAADVGIAVYDVLADAWRVPLAPIDGFPNVPPSAVASDGVTDAVWLGLESGELYRLEVAADRWEPVSFRASGPIIRLIPDPSEGVLWAGTPDGWYRVRDDGGFGRFVVRTDQVPGEVRRAGEATTAFRALLGTLGLDPSMRRFEIGPLTESDEPGTYYVGADGGGLLRVDINGGEPEWLPFGTLSRGVGAVAHDAGGFWFGGDGQGPRDGISHATPDLARWTRIEASVEGGPAGFVARILPLADAVWFAASDGLYRLDRATLSDPRPDWDRLTTADGLPADQATAILPSPSGFDAATLRGLVRLDRDGTVLSTALDGRRVLDLARFADTLWVATDVGLFASTGGVPVPAPGTDATPGLRAGPVIAVAAAAGRVLALAPDGLYTRRDGRWSGPDRTAAAELGALLRLQLDDQGGVWIAGERGVLADEAGRVRTWRVPVDIPEGPVRGIMVVGSDLWVVTPAGALRLDRSR